MNQNIIDLVFVDLREKERGWFLGHPLYIYSHECIINLILSG
jgi:hypothetical protein